ncbi:MAG: c-type cytochrome biogenesis protein CcmI [Pseudomonadales bacterium]
MSWLAVLAFAFGGLLFVVPPLLWRNQSAGQRHVDERAATLRQLYLSRRQEMSREAVEGQLAAQDLEVALAELDANFLRDAESLGAQQDASVATSQAPRRAVLALVLGALSLGVPVYLYYALGEPDAAQLANAQSLMQLSETNTAELRAWQAVLGERVARRPEDAKSQYLLGHVALKQRRYQAAADAFDAAHRAHGQNDPGIDLYRLQARFLAAKGTLDEDSRAIAEQLLAMSPNQPAVYEVLAIDAFNRKAFAEAVTILNRALSVPMDVAQRASFATGLEQARAQLGATQGPGIDVRIEGLEAVPPERTLFVIARPPGGGMPYAVVRRPGPDFPSQVRLDDAVSMNPATPLSAAPMVEVVVRASASGNAMRGPDDWQWSSATLQFAEQQQHAVVATLSAPGAAAPATAPDSGG